MTAANPHATPHHDADHGHDHPPHLAHHFDTPEQQYDSAKIGMWVFLATEILMFGGLFCAYAVYRYNNPDVFRYSEHHLNTWLGATNTVVLLASSLTMALAVRAAQLGQQTYLKLMLVFTLLGGVGFMCIKAVEYTEKFSHGLVPGAYNEYNRDDAIKKDYLGIFSSFAHHDEEHGDEAAAGGHGEGNGEGDHAAATRPGAAADTTEPQHGADAEGMRVGTEHGADAVHGDSGEVPGPTTPADQVDPEVDTDPTAAAGIDLSAYGPDYVDPNANSSDAALIRPAFNSDSGLAHAAHGDGHAAVEYGDLTLKEQSNVKAFFSIYFAMTGLHGLHVLIGMGLIGWVFVKSLSGTFGPAYFTPVDIVGLYWHLVDLIWIFLFPLLYLIH